MQNRHLTSDIDRKLLSQFHTSKYTKEQAQFIKDNIVGKTSNELTEMFNNYFKLNLDGDQIRSYISNHGLTSGVNCEFGKGHIPFNKGVTGIWYKGSEKTWFKKGQEPINHREVGSERITVDNYTEVKVAEPNKWRLKHQLVWEKYNGKIAKGYAVIFGDGNRQNSDINNLILVNRQQLLILNKNKLIQNDADLTRTGVIIADLYQKISKIKRDSL
ncbi:HNH endonuclease (plasmid) [Clostridium estertheticum]|nr:HNH endonuclease [Clostridium estertheticum]WLC73335.1 HNH endonuclease [Clostridium estertheticum]